MTQVAADLQISEQAIYGWRRQHLIDTGELPGLNSTDNAELVAARRRIAELETELAITRRAAELLKAAVPTRRFEAIAVMAGEGLPGADRLQVLDVTDSGYYAWRGRGPSAREVHQAWLTDLIRQVHAGSNGIYGARRLHVGLTLGHGVMVGTTGSRC